MPLTLAELRTEVLDPIDMNDATIVDEAEVTRYINKGIKAVEAVIHNLYEDYYLDNADLSLVNGQRAYDLPSDIYADKIRKISYNDGNDNEYEILRIKHIEEKKFINDAQDQGNSDYMYEITNNVTNGRKINIYPTPNENTTMTDSVSYIRRAKQLSLDGDILDIPEEFDHVVILYAQTKCLKKDLANPQMHTDYTNDLKAELDLMVDTLSNRQPDRDDNIRIDMSFYRDFYSNGLWDDFI